MNKNLLLLLFGICTMVFACKYTQKITDGKTAFERMQYAVATEMLQKEFQKEKSRVEKGKIAFLLGESYKKINKNSSAIQWYKTAYDNQFGIDALKEYAYALKKNEEYGEAKRAFKELGLELGSPYEYRREITACEIAMDWKKRAKESVFTIEPSSFNSKSAEYAPTLYKNNQLVFTSDRSSSVGDETYNWTGNNFSDLFIVNTESNTVEAFDAKINTPNNEGTVAFNKSLTEMYFSRCYDDEDNDYYCKLMVSVREGDSWSDPKVLSFVEPNVNYGHPALSDDGESLYYSANHPDGWGGYDIFVVKKNGEDWEEPKLLGRNVNTIGDEKFPFIEKDTLYFASNHHPGMGGLDIFKTYRMNDAWTPVQNLKSPINSGADDFGYIVDPSFVKKGKEIQAGYFSSSRIDGEGNDDIYRFVRKIPPPPPPPPPVEETKKEEPKPIVYKMILEGFVLEKIYSIADNPNSKVIGRRPLADSNVEIRFGKEKKNVKVGADGMFTIELEENSDYNFFGSREGYLNNTARFSSRGIAKDPNNPITKHEVEIVLDKIFKNKEITLDNIYYDYEKWDIRPDAEPTLNALANTLIRNPQVKVQLASHTDCRGKANYNQTLSQKRAQSAVDYLISKGIAPERLGAIGYGKSAPALDCACSKCSEEEHQANRRTTFKVVD